MQDMWFHYMQTVDKLQIFIASLCNSIFLNESLANVWLFFIVLTSTEFFLSAPFHFFHLYYIFSLSARIRIAWLKCFNLFTPLFGHCQKVFTEDTL